MQPLDCRDVAPWVEENEDEQAYKEEREAQQAEINDYPAEGIVY
jgi:hypothetical protein